MDGAEERFYGEDEAEQILRLASSISSSAEGMTRERLLATAAEIGISPEAVDEAERQIISKRTEAADRKAFDAERRRDFGTHLISFVLVNAFLCAINYLTSRGYFWEIWPLLGWGLGLAFHAAEVFLKGSDGYQKEFARWQKRQRRREARKSLALHAYVRMGDDLGHQRRREAQKSLESEAFEDLDVVIDRYVHKKIDHELRKVDAILYLRDKKNMDLSSAKDAVDQYVAKNPGSLE